MKKLDEVILICYFIIIINITACITVGSVFLINYFLKQIDGFYWFTGVVFATIALIIILLIIYRFKED